jgi:hypothetical protein
MASEPAPREPPKAPFSLLAGIVGLFHLAFLWFVLFGGLFFSSFPWLIWLHVPAVAYAILAQIIGWRCPLTDLEKWLRSLGGQRPYGAGFLSRYVWSSIGSTATDVFLTAGFVAAIVLVNARAYLAWAAT